MEEEEKTSREVLLELGFNKKSIDEMTDEECDVFLYWTNIG